MENNVEYYLKVRDDLKLFEVKLSNKTPFILKLIVRRESSTCDYFILKSEELKFKVSLPFFKEKVVELSINYPGIYNLRINDKDILGSFIIIEDLVI